MAEACDFREFYQANYGRLVALITALTGDRYASDALAVETEGHGFLESAYANAEVDALVRVPPPSWLSTRVVLPAWRGRW